jgi:acyl-CoA reductase-like NAD-dependent aldehyde dehydrogenase
MASSTEIARPATAGDTPTRHGHIIGGTCEPAPEAGLLPVLAPCTGRIIAEVARGDAGDVARAVAAARAAFPGWRGQTPGDRAKVLMAMADRVDQHVDELVDLESRNVGKPASRKACGSWPEPRARSRPPRRTSTWPASSPC